MDYDDVSNVWVARLISSRLSIVSTRPSPYTYQAEIELFSLNSFLTDGEVAARDDGLSRCAAWSLVVTLEAEYLHRGGLKAGC